MQYDFHLEFFLKKNTNILYENKGRHTHINTESFSGFSVYLRIQFSLMMQILKAESFQNATVLAHSSRCMLTLCFQKAFKILNVLNQFNCGCI